MRRFASVVSLILLVSALIVGDPATPPATAAATLFVDDDLGCDDATADSSVTPYCTIQAAVMDAVSGDTIQIAAGTYTGSGAVVVVDLTGHVKDLEFVGAGEGSTIIDGQNARGGFRLIGPANYAMRDLTITNGFSAGSAGGLIVQTADAELLRVTVSDSEATVSGGGIYVSDGSTLTVSDSTISGNSATVGGGIYVSQNASLTVNQGTVLADNLADEDGGGIAVPNPGTTVTIDDAVFQGNWAEDRGGGLFVSAYITLPVLTITDTEFVNNRTTVSTAAGQGGGGAYFEAVAGTVARSLFTGNESTSHGGGLMFSQGEGGGISFAVENTTFSDNDAAGQGGGAFSAGTFNNTTFTGNTAVGVGGGLSRNGITAATVGNSILYGNTSTADATTNDCYAVNPSGYNLVGTGEFTCGGDGTSIYGQDPGLAILGSVGGATRAHAITDTSPAYNAGNPDTPGDGGGACSAEDQRGLARGADRCDIGAYEVSSLTGGISGTVTAAGSGLPISGITVTVYSSVGVALDTTTTSGTGHYGFGDLTTPDSYLVGFATNSVVYRAEWWDNKPDLASATAIPVGQGEVVASIDAELSLIPVLPPPFESPTVGLVDPLQGQWRLRNSTGAVTSFFFGNPGDYPIMGDWDCDGIDTPGMYRQSDGYVYLRNANTQGVANIRFFFGNPGDVPIAGDFNNDGCDTVSIYRPSNQTFYIINALGKNDGGLGAADFSYVFGNPGDKPFVGDFNGNGTDTVGLHREATGFVYFRNTHTQGNAHAQFFFGDPNDRFITGDWNANGTDTPGIFRPGNATFYFRFTNTQGNADNQFTWGSSGWLPVSGNFGLG